jgi:transposase-like protein
METQETEHSGLPLVSQATGSSAEAEQAAQLPSARTLGAEEAGRVSRPRRKLSDEQEREVTRLYAETTTAVPEIAGRFGIGESSVYRVAQRHGAALRGRAPASGRPEREPSTVSTTVAVQQTRTRARASRTSPRSVQAPVAAARRQEAAKPGMQRAGGARQFRIRFEREVVVEAVDIHDAVLKAEKGGATEIIGVRLED